jgi:hypothetical protein
MDVLDRGGVLLRFGKDLFGFIPASVAVRLTSLSSVADVPGLAPPAVGIALVEGVVVTVLTLQPSDAVDSASTFDPEIVPGSDCAILCDLGGVLVALTGGRVIATGAFGIAKEGGITWRGNEVAAVDVRALYTQAETKTWMRREARLPRRTSGAGEPE